ncbi:2-acylglycerol O-acyltransferase 1 [Folsomia candida]|uniref:Acyltransferase n=1 Tax=Folsomia candida TaxID=158441 RepID=A0A226CW83_FOLCA|nr:2-acylglycerol O-acyltransferase 1 [Folsomia candida]OXA36778.1 2-acylglycerol O-acyltransferase 1 [Folsomia candida]
MPKGKLLEKDGKRVLGVEFAPTHLPLERRLQTASIIAWFLIMIAWPLVSYPVFFYATFFTQHGYLFTIPYLIWIYADKQQCNKGGRKVGWTRRWKLWDHYRDYFPIKLVKTVDLPPGQNYLFGSHPHGILCSGAFSTFATDSHEVEKLFPGLSFSVLTLEINFLLPLIRDLILGLGVCSATRESMNYLLSRPGGGVAAVLIPGGAPESLDSHPGSYVVQLKNKKGFIKVAMQNGASLVPVFSFGETEIFDQLANPKGSFLRTIQDKLQQMFQIAPAAFHGRGVFQYSFGPLPRRRAITTVVGAPIPVKKIAQPTLEELNAMHQRYVDAVVELFYKHRDEYAHDPTHVIAIV